ncbi:MAG: acetyl-coenzyme A synthetase N-terminal domain-containing protein, partial [bacterium]
MSDDLVFKPAPSVSKTAHIKSLEQYREMYDQSVQQPDIFWGRIAERLHWYKKWDRVCDFDFIKANIKWFEGGKLNISYNCLDRHVEAGHGDQTALIWESNHPETHKTYTYSDLLENVQKFANVL